MDSFSTTLLNFLREKFNLNPNKLDVFLSAFTHSSIKSERLLEDYERLELLGDACIDLVTLNLLYELELPLKSICNLKKEIVSGVSLSFLARKLNLSDYLRAGKGCSITDSILEDLYESFVGAVYLSFGFNRAKELIVDTLWKSFLNKELPLLVDYKTKLQEFVQSSCREKISYVCVNSTKSPETGYFFSVEVSWGGKVMGKGSGKKLKEAEQNAAKEALQKFEK